MGEENRGRQIRAFAIYVVLGLLLIWALQSVGPQPARPRVVPYSELVTLVRQGKIGKAEIRDEEIIATLKSEGAPQSGAKPSEPAQVVAKRIPRMDEAPLVKDMEDRSVEFLGRSESVPWWQTALFGWMLPLALMIGVYAFILRRMSRGGPLNVGRNRAKIYDVAQQDRVTFTDVAGVDEAEGELVEVVEFLRNSAKYTRLGARIPRGVLLVGPPGTGKTLLARAVAGEAGVPFFSLSGSEFVEMFVGLGAARMRDLFEQAKQRAPCIVFIDELDAIGKSRGGLAALATHDEREQTLNQLLVEMDGFDPSKGVIIMAATNRPEVLDQALVRPGRFDRQVLVDRPDVRGREAILRVHMRKVKLDTSVDIQVLARRTVGMVGADLANVVNEAALAAGRRGSQLIEGEDFEEAIDRIQLGLKKKGRVMNDDEKRRVAYHEAGHALVALSLKHADPVHRVTIIPRSIGALGATLQLPTEERYTMTREELLDRVCVMMGGRTAEELACADVSTGAENDLEIATETARRMVARFGMSEKLGPMTLARQGGLRYLSSGLGWDEPRDISDETARTLDIEVRTLIDGQHERARSILAGKRPALERIAQRLLDKETIERAELEECANTDGSASRSAARAETTRDNP